MYFDDANNNDNSNDNNSVSLIFAYIVMMNGSYKVITPLSLKNTAAELSMIAFEMQNKQVLWTQEQVSLLPRIPSLRSRCKFLLRSNVSHNSRQWALIPFKALFIDLLISFLIYYFNHSFSQIFKCIFHKHRGLRWVYFYISILSVAFCAGQRYLCYLSEVCHLWC